MFNWFKKKESNILDRLNIEPYDKYGSRVPLCLLISDPSSELKNNTKIKIGDFVKVSRHNQQPLYLFVIELSGHHIKLACGERVYEKRVLSANGDETEILHEYIDKNITLIK